MTQYLKWNPETGRISGEMNHGKRDEEAKEDGSQRREAGYCTNEKESQKRMFKIMPTFLKQYQNIIHSNDAIKLGKKQVAESTGVILTDFLHDIMDNVMAVPNKSYLIQWAISELKNEEVKDAP